MFVINRPIICFDLETTGLDPKTARIMEIAVIKVHAPDRIKEWATLINPGIPIPKEASDATRSTNRPNGITDELVKDAPTFKSIAEGIASGFTGCDFVGANVRGYDLAILQNELERAGCAKLDLAHAKIVDVLKVYHSNFKRDLTAAVKEYLNEDIGDAHEALVDARATWRVALAQLERHELPRDPAAHHEMFYGTNGNSIAGGKFVIEEGVCFVTFGKYKGTALKDIADRGYMSWVINKSDLEPEVKKVFRDALVGTFPK